MTLTEKSLRTYLRTFHFTYRILAERYILPELRDKLVRYAHLDERVIGYLSSSFGVGYEYEPGRAGIEIRTSSQRVEQMLFRAPHGLRSRGLAIRNAGRNTTLSGVTVRGMYPIELAGDDASARILETRCEDDTWARYVSYAEIFANRSRARWSQPAAEIDARDEILEARFDLSQAGSLSVSLEDYLGRFKQKTVLLLGDFRARRRLELIQTSLRSAGYHPVLLDEIPDDPNYDLPGKFRAVASVVRFLVFDDSTPSGHLTELEIARSSGHVSVVLRANSQSTFMTKGLSATSKIMEEFACEEGDIEAIVNAAIEWAEGTLAGLRRSRDAYYPWRQPSQ